MQFVQFRWIFWNRETPQPPKGSVLIGTIPQQVFQILQYRERQNMNEMGLQEPIWSEWTDVK